jgi:hypothetical protein
MNVFMLILALAASSSTSAPSASAPDDFWKQLDPELDGIRVMDRAIGIDAYSRIPSQITISVDAETIGATVFIHHESGDKRSAERS